MRRKFVFVLIGVLAIALVIALTAYWKGYVPSTDRHVIRLAESVAADELRDPSSALFRREKVTTFTSGELAGRRGICGEVNGKNAQGAYAGFTRFIAATDRDGGVMFEPQSNYSEGDQRSAQAGCEADGRSLSGLIRIKSACERVIDIIKDRAPLNRFNEHWDAVCESPKAVAPASGSPTPTPTPSPLPLKEVIASAPAARPVILEAGPLDPCSNGVIGGLKAGGDGFVSLRSAPTTDGVELARLHNGDQVYTCDSANGWTGVVVRKNDNDDCGGSPMRGDLPKSTRYSGPCRSGWISSKYVSVWAG